MIPISCPCGKRLNVRPEHAGRTIRCGCGREHQVPGGSRWRWSLRVSRRAFAVLYLLCWGWLASVVAAVALLWWLGDRWWPGTLFLYGPRWPLLIPAPVLLLGALVVRRRLAIPIGIGILLMLGPVLGFRTGWRGWFGAEGAATLRVITFNMRSAQNSMATTVAESLLQYQPDLVLVQECAAEVRDRIGVPAGWTVHQHLGLCLLSQWPVDSVEALEVVQTREDGMSGMAVHYRIRAASEVISVVNVHLETPRRGIEQFRWGGEVRGLGRSIIVRDAGSRRTAQWVNRVAPDAIVAGDFNLPPESVIFRRHWGGCANAFAERGRGFGYTRILPKWSARIDHVLTCGPSWEAVSAVLGPDLGSDHLPVIVDLRRR